MPRRPRRSAPSPGRRPLYSYPGTWSFGVRAYDTVDGLEEQNVDCVVTIILNASGVDITSQPPAPMGLRAFRDGSRDHPR